MAKTVRVLHHDNCFDGIASAAVFSRFYRDSIDPEARFEYQGLAHKAGQYIFESYFSGDENAIVDFKYSASERLTWWFDHHESADMQGVYTYTKNVSNIHTPSVKKG